jgi:Holliday junction resolvasome RuvABC DNA-binding subunit
LNQVLKGIDFTFVNPFGQALDVGRRQVRSKEGNTENDQKLQMAEQKMGLLSAMGVLGKEAAAAMTSVEAQQQRLTLQRLISMVSFTISA